MTKTVSFVYFCLNTSVIKLNSQAKSFSFLLFPSRPLLYPMQPSPCIFRGLHDLFLFFFFLRCNYCFFRGIERRHEQFHVPCEQFLRTIAIFTHLRRVSTLRGLKASFYVRVLRLSFHSASAKKSLKPPVFCFLFFQRLSLRALLEN